MLQVNSISQNYSSEKNIFVLFCLILEVRVTRIYGSIRASYQLYFRKIDEKFTQLQHKAICSVLYKYCTYDTIQQRGKMRISKNYMKYFGEF